MAALDFPASPTNGQKYPNPAVAGVPQYTWDGEKWTMSLSSGGGDFLPLAGGTMTGALHAPRVFVGAAVDNNPTVIFKVGDNATAEFGAWAGAFEFDKYSDIFDNGANLYLTRCRGTLPAQLSVQNGDWLGTIVFAGQPTATSWAESASVNGIVDGVPGEGSLPVALTFTSGTADWGIERLRISSTGKVKLTNPVAITDTDQVPTKAYVDSGDSGKQAADATLTALAGLNATVGLVEQTGTDVFTKRAIGAAAATDVLTRANGDARYALTDAGLTALAALDATAGLLEQTALDTFTKRALGVAAATSVLTRADGDGRYATMTAATTYYGTKTISTLAPSGGVDGDVWYQVT